MAAAAPFRLFRDSLSAGGHPLVHMRRARCCPIRSHVSLSCSARPVRSYRPATDVHGDARVVGVGGCWQGGLCLLCSTSPPAVHFRTAEPAARALMSFAGLAGSQWRAATGAAVMALGLEAADRHITSVPYNDPPKCITRLAVSGRTVPVGAAHGCSTMLSSSSNMKGSSSRRSWSSASTGNGNGAGEEQQQAAVGLPQRRSETVAEYGATVEEVPVVICGAGPTGLTMSLLLAKYGIHHVVLERSQSPTQHPQAHFINNRTMEIFRNLGLATPVRQMMPPLEAWRRFVYCESVAGRLYGEVDHFQGQSSPLSPRLSPEPVAHLPQHRLVKIMLQRQAEVAAAAAEDALPPPAAAVLAPLISVLGPDGRLTAPRGPDAVSWGGELRGVNFRCHDPVTPCGAPAAAVHNGMNIEVEVELVSQPPGVSRPVATTTVTSTTAAVAPETVAAASAPAAVPGLLSRVPRGVRVSLRCQFLVAADGAHSAVRQLMGGMLEGEGAMQHLLNAHFTSTALANISARRPAMLYFVFNPEVVAVVVAHDISRGEFVAQIPYFPPLQSPEDFPPERVVQLIRAAVGQEVQGRSEKSSAEVDVQLLQLRAWTMTAEVADRFTFGPATVRGMNQAVTSVAAVGSCSPPAVFLVGDSAHRFPPAGGFGMNTGVQDAGNLAWKLASVLRGLAGSKLLESYQLERRPIALANTTLSVKNWVEATRVPAALGLDPWVATAVNTLITNAAPLPLWARKGLLEAALETGRKLAGPEGLPVPLLGAWRQQELQRILSSGASLRLQFPAEDLGFMYDKGAVVVRQANFPAATSTVSDLLRAKHGTSTAAAAAASQLPRRGAPYIPSSAPGCRLPHCWLQLLQQPRSSSPGGQMQSSGGDAVIVSTVDVVADPWVGPRLVLFTDGHHRGNQNFWLAAALKLYECEPHPDSYTSPLESPPAGSMTSVAGASSVEHWGPLVVVHVLPAAADAEPSPATQEVKCMPNSTATVVHEPPVGSVLSPGRCFGGTASRQHLQEGGGSVCVDAVRVVELWEAEHGGWLQAMGLTPGSCLLVRPDGHVAWRHLGPPRGRASSHSFTVTLPIPMTSAADADAAAATTAVDAGVASADPRDVAAAAAELRFVLEALQWRLPGSDSSNASRL